MTNQIHKGAGLFLLMLSFSFACNGPTVPSSMQVMTVARHNSEKFPTAHGDSQNRTHDCNVCHGGFDSFSQFTCVGCHEKDPTGRAHAGVAAYKYASENCYACHPAGVAEGGGSHRFPIQAGTPHDEAQCEQCHTAGDYKSFSCVDCHDHARSEMDSEHAGITSYVYASTNCLRCHPDGEGFDAAQHEPFFPIASGTHAEAQCSACHATGDYQSFSCVGCHEHAQSPMNTAHAGVPSYVFASANCLGCHPKGQAFGAAQHTSFFPITSGAHAGYQCKDCHSDGTNFGIYSCIGCHEGEHTCSSMNDKHSSVNGYQCADASCLSCHPDGRH